MWSILQITKPSCSFVIFLGDPGKLAPKKNLAMTRKNLRLAVGCLTGHCQLRKDLHTMGLVDTPLCRICEQEGKTLGHVLRECFRRDLAYTCQYKGDVS